MAALPSDRVRKGFWIDYTHGPVLGATITTSSSDANLIIAFLSVLVTFAGSHFWQLTAFTRFWIGVSDKPRSAFHHQLQLLIRNITSPGALLFEIVLLGWSWRSHGALSRLATLAALAVTCSIGFLVAGIFVSQIVSTSGLYVLAYSQSCGWITWRNETTDRNRDYQQTVFDQAINYVRTCYNQTGPVSQCNIYVKQAVPIQEMAHTISPFPEISNSTAIRLDTGLLDSNDIFGINAPFDLGVKIQRVFTCVPIDADEYSTARTLPLNFSTRYFNRDPLPGEQLFEWYLGPIAGNLGELGSTVQQSSYKVNFSAIIDLTPRAYYVPTNHQSINGWHNSTFNPIPALRRDDADTHIVAFQNNALRFFRPNDDPIFAAHTNMQVFFDDNSNITMYVADKRASFLGCAEQMRFCFAQRDCTSLLGAGPAYVQAQKLAPTSEQNATLRYLFFQSPNFYEVTRAPMLVARNAASFQLGIPPNQWEAEVQNWVRFLLAVTQTAITHIAAGPGIVRPDFDQLTQPLGWPGFCSSQRMGAPNGYSSINVFSLALVLALSGVVILTNLSLVPILKCLHRRYGYFHDLLVSWDQEGIIQVHRRAYEGAGSVELLDRDTAIPNTKVIIGGGGSKVLVDRDGERDETSLGASPAPDSDRLTSSHFIHPRNTVGSETLQRPEEVEAKDLDHRNYSRSDFELAMESGPAPQK